MKSKSRRYATKIKFTVKEMEFLSNNEDQQSSYSNEVCKRIVVDLNKILALRAQTYVHLLIVNVQSQIATNQLTILKNLFLKICLFITAFANYLPAFSKSCAAANSNRLLENSFTLEEIESKKITTFLYRGTQGKSNKIKKFYYSSLIVLPSRFRPYRIFE